MWRPKHKKSQAINMIATNVHSAALRRQNAELTQHAKPRHQHPSMASQPFKAGTVAD